MMDSIFDEWFEKHGYGLQHKEFARIVWNAAISAASDLVNERYDPHEPWLLPSEVTDKLGT